MVSQYPGPLRLGVSGDLMLFDGSDTEVEIEKDFNSPSHLAAVPLHHQSDAVYINPNLLNISPSMSEETLLCGLFIESPIASNPPNRNPSAET